MNKLLTKMGLGEKMSKNFLAILIVAFSGAIIYGLPYFRFDYYDVYLETYHLTNGRFWKRTRRVWYDFLLVRRYRR